MNKLICLCVSHGYVATFRVCKGSCLWSVNQKFNAFKSIVNDMGLVCKTEQNRFVRVNVKVNFDP